MKSVDQLSFVHKYDLPVQLVHNSIHSDVDFTSVLQ